MTKILLDRNVLVSKKKELNKDTKHTNRQSLNTFLLHTMFKLVSFALHMSDLMSLLSSDQVERCLR